MPDYSLGRAHGSIEIDYKGDGATKAARDLDKVADASASADKSLTKTQRTVRDTGREMDSAGGAAAGYQARLRDVEDASQAVEAAERRHRSALLDTRASLDDIKKAHDDVAAAKKRHARAADAAAAAEKAMVDGLSGARRVVASVASVVSDLPDKLARFGSASDSAGSKAAGLAGMLDTAASAAARLGHPELAGGLKATAGGVAALNVVAGELAGAVKGLAAFEVAFGKVAGLSLALPSLAGLAGLGGAAGVQGLVNMADAVKQLTGVLGLLPAMGAGVGVVMGTLAVAFNGVDDALKNMMSDDPTKFLESIKNMAPAAAQAMLTIAGFRDQFKAAGGAVQESLFSKILDDIAPLIQTWLPALTQAGVQVAGVIGEIASQFAGLLQQPQVMAAFTEFIDNVAAGLQAMAPALAPALDIFSRLVTVGGSFFTQLGGHLVKFMQFFDQIVARAQASGDLQNWIQTGINAFLHLANAAYSFGSAFLNIMTIAEQFGGGGLLGWLEKLGEQFNNWTQSAEGQQALTDFFSTLRTATDAFTPILGPLLDGLMSIGKAFVDLGVSIAGNDQKSAAGGWLSFFQMFAQAMGSLGPHIVSIGPALNQFLSSMGAAMVNLVNQVGPQLPELFVTLSNAFSALLPQIGPLVTMFMELVTRVGPQLPELFGSFTLALEQTIPLLPTIIGLIGAFVDGLTLFMEANAMAIRGMGVFIDGIMGMAEAIGGVPEKIGRLATEIGDFFGDLATQAIDWGKNLIINLVKGIADNTVIGSLLSTLGGVGQHIVDFFKTSSPAKRGPLHDISPNEMGERVVRNFAAGMVSAQSAVESAAGSTAAAASGALGSGGAPAAGGAEGVGGSLLPPWIAGADNSVLSAYLNHQFDDSRGLKGLAKDFGNFLQVAQSGFNLLNQGVMQNVFTALGLVPGMNAQRWQKMSAEDLAASQQQSAQRDALKNQDNKPNWQDVLGPNVAPGDNGTGGPGKPPGPNASQQDVANYIYSSARANGYTDAEAKAFVVQGFGESGLRGSAFGATTGDASGGASGVFQFTPGTARDFGLANPLDAKENIDAYFRLAQARDPRTGDIRSRLAAISGGGPAHPSNVGHWDTALAGSKPFIEALGTDVAPSWQQVTGTPQSVVPVAAMAPSGTYGLPAGTDIRQGEPGFPDWVYAVAEKFGLQASTYAGHQEDRGQGNQGIDWWGPPEARQAFAEYLAANAANIPGLEDVIFRNPNTGQDIGVNRGRLVGTPGSADPGYFRRGHNDFLDHDDHVHTTQSAPIPLPDGAVPVGGGGVGGTAGSGLVLPSGQSVDALLDAANQNVSVNDQLLQAYLQGNPALAAQIDAAKTPGAADQQVLSALTSMDSTINDLKTQDAIGNKNTIDALSSAQRQIAEGAGFQQNPSALSQAQGMMSSIGGAVSSIFQVAQSGLDALAATQDIADVLVYGVRNTEDVSRLIDDWQKYITLAASIFSAAGSILSTAGSFTGGADMGGTGAAGGMLSLIASMLEGVNMAIDFGQQVYHIVGSYVGKFLSQLTAGLGGTPLMGDVRFLLNKNTNQLISYSQDNPGNKNYSDVPSWMRPTYDAGPGSNPNPTNNVQWNIYAGPGQSPGEMLNEVVWMYNTQGTSGAMQPANF